MQVTGIREGKRDKREKVWAGFVPIYPTACFYNSQKSFKFALEDTQSFSFWLQHVVRKPGAPLKKQALSYMKLCLCPSEQASATHLSRAEYMCTQQGEERKTKILIPHLHHWSPSPGEGSGAPGNPARISNYGFCKSL